ncbi:transposase family protein, partial [Pseudonocardia sp. RS010]|uniref:transposase family protein n=1 Tax=Pseudonocardia sp. RS010 TaxID=3385979 RepID=UPI0039A03DFF
MGGVEPPDPVELAPDLREALGAVTDPRKPRGIRHGRVAVLTVAVCPVAAGARSLVAIAERAADLPEETAAALGSRHPDRDGGEIAGRHLLAVVDHHSRVVLGQTAVGSKAGEIARFAPRLDGVTGLDPSGAGITADALHTQREHVQTLHARGPHWVLTVKGNQPTVHRQLADLPWRDVEVGHRSVENTHGRREIRALQVVTIATGIE